ncbi:isoprenylcysteine carboxylmethyltransferase family protein [Candidatus Woesearchaeota archaeon]|nr:isoprenylcysteine carboxylmethyltransferase family protein [Candidatus Woesearchaeota archaeon]
MNNKTKQKLLSPLGLGEVKKTDKNSLPIIYLSLGVIAIVVLTDVMLKRPVYNNWYVIPGLTLFIIGFVLRGLGHVGLGKNFAYEVKVRKDHELVTKGIHSMIRHPMYTGMFLLVVGICLVVQSMFGIIATIVVLVPAGMYRINVEESAMLKKFGKKYSTYKRKTKSLVPYVW